MREGIEKKLPKEGIQKESGPPKPEEKAGLTALKEEIKKVIQNFSAETFEKTKKEKTEERVIGEKKEGTMKEYPAKRYDFREAKWFQKLTPEEREKIELKILNFIHKTARKELKGLYRKFFEKLPPEVQKYFNVNKRIIPLKILPPPPPELLKEEVIKAIEEYKKQFGFPPGGPYTLELDCATFTNFLGKLYEHYGFKSAPVTVLPEVERFSHEGLLVELKGNKRYVSDVNFRKPLPLKEWIGEIGKVRKEKIKIRNIIVGYFGGYASAVYSNLGQFLEHLERHDEAEKEFREAIRINPNNILPHIHLGKLLWHVLKKFHEAENEFREVLKIKPKYPEVLAELGLLHREMGKIDEARDEILKARELFEERGDIKNVEKCDEILKKISKSH